MSYAPHVYSRLIVDCITLTGKFRLNVQVQVQKFRISYWFLFFFFVDCNNYLKHLLLNHPKTLYMKKELILTPYFGNVSHSFLFLILRALGFIQLIFIMGIPSLTHVRQFFLFLMKPRTLYFTLVCIKVF